jgi:hypothetical protein
MESNELTHRRGAYVQMDPEPELKSSADDQPPVDVLWQQHYRYLPLSHIR